VFDCPRVTQRRGLKIATQRFTSQVLTDDVLTGASKRVLISVFRPSTCHFPVSTGPKTPHAGLMLILGGL
jgi:hypothetical protein